MPDPPTYPGVYIRERPDGDPEISGVSTAITAFLGRPPQGPEGEPTAIRSFADYERLFGGLSVGDPLGYAIRDFFLNGGTDGIVVRLSQPLARDPEAGLSALDGADLFNLLCIPPETRDGTTPKHAQQAALEYCVRRRAILLVDPPAEWDGAATARARVLEDVGLNGPGTRNAALYFPRLLQADPLKGGSLDRFVPCGAVAGVMARNDAQRGVWKAPAGVQAELRGTAGLAVQLNNLDMGHLNEAGINSLRTLPGSGPVVWGARTLRAGESPRDEYMYLPVRRLALYLEESLLRGTGWAVFEPNDEPLWARLRWSIGAFLDRLFREGALQGSTPREAYFVKVGRDTTTPSDLSRGVVNLMVGFAATKPAEFVVLTLPQRAGTAA